MMTENKREMFHKVMAMLTSDKYKTANELVHAIIDTVDTRSAKKGEGNVVSEGGGCCCGETDEAWRLCPAHGPAAPDMGGD
jgi:hypothetical protein